MLISSLIRRSRAIGPGTAQFVSVVTASSGEASLPHSVMERRLESWSQTYKQKQYSAMTPYVQKINVDYVGKVGDSCSLQMTKGLSTPMDCAKHLSQLLVDRSVVALVDGVPWDLHRPIESDCAVDFVHFKDAHHDPDEANKAFWRSASFLLAVTMETAFRPEHGVRLLRNWQTTPEQGSFVCDIAFTPAETNGPTEDSRSPWIPSRRELEALSSYAQRLASEPSDFIPLQVPRTHELCAISDASPLEQPDSNSQTALFYRMGGFVQECDVSPLASSTRMFGRFSVTRFYPLGWLRGCEPSAKTPTGVLVYRVHGTAIPAAFPTHFTTFERIVRWSREPNPGVTARPDYVVPF